MSKRRGLQKTMEMPDAPSGYVKLYNYKEPFMKFEGGHGFRGVLLFDGREDTVQCHLCGDWFRNLSHHLHREHAMTASMYKARVGLLNSTALLSETERLKLTWDAEALEKRKKNLRLHNKRHTKQARKRIGNTLRKNAQERLEGRNITGTCPEQLIGRLRALAEKLGRTPTHDEIKNAETLRFAFGSVKEALKRARLPYRKSGENAEHRTKKQQRVLETGIVLQAVNEFPLLHGRIPTPSDITRGKLPIETLKYKSWYKNWGTLLQAAGLSRE